VRFLVLGSGLQGSACAFDLLASTDAAVTLADQAPERLAPFLAPYLGKRLAVLKVDATDARNMRDAMHGHDAVLSAVPYYLNVAMAALAVDLGIHFADLGGNKAIVEQQLALDTAARRQHVGVVPDCGLAPGLVNIVALEAVRRMERCASLALYVGGLPQHPEPPLNYTIVYSPEGVIDYYTTPSWVLRDGQPVQVDALSELESVDFPPPIGTLEAFHTGGGVSLMPWEFAGQIETMEYKTLRYPGHAHIMHAIRELGLLGTEPVDVHGVAVVPREAFIATASPRLRRPEAHDLVALEVVARGTKNRAPASVRFRLLDYYDAERGISAMMRTTGYSLSITGQMLVDGRMAQHGVHPAYAVTPYAEYVKELAQRGITIEELGNSAQ
jgi:lysine 6-dehydrogenase